MHMPCMAASRAAGICDKKHKGPSLVGLSSKASNLKFYKLLTSLDATAASASEGTSRGGMRLHRVRLGSYISICLILICHIDMPEGRCHGCHLDVLEQRLQDRKAELLKARKNGRR